MGLSHCRSVQSITFSKIFAAIYFSVSHGNIFNGSRSHSYAALIWWSTRIHAQTHTHKTGDTFEHVNGSSRCILRMCVRVMPQQVFVSAPFVRLTLLSSLYPSLTHSHSTSISLAIRDCVMGWDMFVARWLAYAYISCRQIKVNSI